MRLAVLFRALTYSKRPEACGIKHIDMQSRPLFCLLLLLSCISKAQQPAPAVPQQGGAAIQIVEGDGAINSIRLQRGHDPVVRVVSPDGEPVAGAIVTFLLPATGPSASFADKGLSITVVTDDHGVAIGRDLRPNRVPGQFRIRVTTNSRDSAAVATLVQTNAEPVIHSGHSKTIAIIVVIAGAAIGGAALALGQKSGSTGQSATTGAPAAAGTIISGSPGIGPPH
jgi:hypothetical protein